MSLATALFVTVVRYVLITFTLDDTQITDPLQPSLVDIDNAVHVPVILLETTTVHHFQLQQQQPSASSQPLTRPPNSAKPVNVDLIEAQLGDETADCRRRRHGDDVLGVPRRASLPAHCDVAAVRDRDQCRPLPTCRDVLLDPRSADDLASRATLLPGSMPTDAQLMNWTRTAIGQRRRPTNATGVLGATAGDGMTAESEEGGGCIVWRSMFGFDRNVEISDDELNFPIAFNLLVHTNAYQV